MSTVLTHKLRIEDGDGASINFESLPVDDDVDWSDAEQATLVRLEDKEGAARLSRQDVIDLRDFLGDVLLADGVDL